MKAKLNLIGNVAALIGILVCLAAVIGRFVGAPQVGQFQAINVFIVGIGLMVLACLAKIEAK
jgi:hypothetical protein